MVQDGVCFHKRIVNGKRTRTLFTLHNRLTLSLELISRLNTFILNVFKQQSHRLCTMVEKTEIGTKQV